MPKKQTRKKKPPAIAPRKVGRPPSPYPLTTKIRHNDHQIAAWRTAAALCGLTLQSWVQATLDGETRAPTHTQLFRTIHGTPVVDASKFPRGRRA